MGNYLDKIKQNVDYENLPVEDMDINPYELVIATSKYARQINDKVRKYYGSDVDIQPRNMAMQRVRDGNLNLINIEEAEDGAQKPAGKS